MKISIIGGAGRVGAQIGFALTASELPVDEILLYDIVDSVEGEAMDLQQAAAAAGRKISISWTKNPAACKDSDIIIYVAGLPLSKAGTLNRRQLVGENAKILNGILDKVVPTKKKAVWIVVSNPVDVITYLIAKRVGDKKRVLGISTTTDTARLRTIGDDYMMGEHGGTMFAVNGTATALQISEMGERVVKLKGGSWHTVALVVRDIMVSILDDDKRIMPVSAVLNGEYGLKDVALGVPCMIGRDGIELINQIKLTAEQTAKLKEAAEAVREGIVAADSTQSPRP